MGEKINKDVFSHHGELRYYLAALFVGILILASLFYSKESSERMVKTYAPLVDAAMEIKYETAIAHLWFEEVISGDTQEDIATVWLHLDQAAWYMTAMLDGGENSEGFLFP